VVSQARDTNAAAIAINEQRFAPTTKNVISTDALGTHAFHLLRDGSEGPSLDSILCGLPGLFGPAFPSDINNKGEIVGTYVKGDILSGFIVMNGVAFEISFPGAETTEVSGINAAGTIVGSYLVGGIRHGFMATRN